MIAARTDRALLTASVLMWIVAIFVALMALALGIPAYHRGLNLAYPVILFGIAIAAGISAYGLKKRKRPFHWITATTLVLLTILFLTIWNIAGILGLLVSGFVCLVLSSNWQQFQTIPGK